MNTYSNYSSRHRLPFAFVALVALLAAALMGVSSVAPQDDTGQPGVIQQEGDDDGSQFAGDPSLSIPDFPDGLEWINVEAPLTVEDLRGKVVLLDFWTYGCINCIHMIPVMERLEEEFADELVIISVHSAKFENEGQTENIRQIVQRYGIRHPVINDDQFIVWSMYGANAWPFYVLIDPRGNVYAAQAGEIPYEAFDRVISGMIDHFDSLGEMNRDPIDLDIEGEGDPSRLLAFPGKVLVDADSNRLFIADSNHHRIVIADLTSYEVLAVIGAGRRGLRDGTFDEAAFNQPQGMALRDNVLYVADTNNHAIRAVDLDAGEVSTVAGTGQRGRNVVSFDTVIAEPATTDLRSPWDVAFGEGSTLYIAMAGTHQIWEMDIDANTLTPSVGNGREALINGSLAESELAQPSGLYYRGGLLYFADSESSSIRVADYNEDVVRTLAGPSENNLFEFGDVDGEVGTSRLQHALGVTGSPDDLIYVADTYNHKIKVIDGTEITTLLGESDNGGFRDGGADEARFDEPGGLDYAEGRLYVADTNNHAIRVVDLDAGTVSTVTFPNPEALQIEDQVTVIGGTRASDESVVLPEQTLAAGEGHVVLQLEMAEGYKLNDLATSIAEWSSAGDAITIAEGAASGIIAETEMRVPVTLNEGEGQLNGLVTVYFCEAVNPTLCFIDEFSVNVPVTVEAEGDSEIVISRSLVPPQIDGVGGFD